MTSFSKIGCHQPPPTHPGLILKSKIGALFYLDPAVRIGIEGYAILNRVPSENNDYDVWSMDELNVMNNKIEFKDGIEIRN